MNNIPDQLAMIHQFNEENRIPFNPQLFVDADEGIIECLEKVILSCQRDRLFTIKVEGFEVVEDYDKIIELLRKNEEGFNKNNSKDNIYDYINLKDTVMRLLIVYYYIAINGESDHIKVFICVPRAVNKYYFKINGNMYSAMWQIVDASTYNTATSNSKKDCIAFKTIFPPLRIYRYQTNKKTDLIDYNTKEIVKCTYFTSYVFSKSLLAMKFILAKYGFYASMKFLYLDYVIIHDSYPENLSEEDYYVFSKCNLFVSVPRMLFNGSPAMQSFVYTVLYSINKDTLYRDIFTREYWLKSLASEYNNDTIDKGLSVLDSLEIILDILTKENLALPMEDKEDIYHIIRWIIMEYSNLRLKSNLDISIKRIRKPEYIASLYGMKIFTSICHISDIGKKATIKTIKKALITTPMYLLNAISNCKLVNYVNYVNDMDSLVALKYTFKGIAGIGENNNSMPIAYRAVSKTQLGITDPDASSPGDPGASGTLCPTAKIYKNGLLSDYQEPDIWRDNITNLFNNYRQTVGLKECMIAMDKLLDANTTEKVKELNDTIDQMNHTMKPLINSAYYDNEDLKEIPLEASALIVYIK